MKCHRETKYCIILRTEQKTILDIFGSLTTEKEKENLITSFVIQFWLLFIREYFFMRHPVARCTYLVENWRWLHTYSIFLYHTFALPHICPGLVGCIANERLHHQRLVWLDHGKLGSFCGSKHRFQHVLECSWNGHHILRGWL